MILMAPCIIDFRGANAFLGPVSLDAIWDFPYVFTLKVHKIENLFDSDFGICVISLLVI